MRSRTILLAVLCLAVIPSAAMAQQATMLDKIPAGAMGYVFISNLDAGATKLDAFLKETGISQAAHLPPKLLSVLMENLQLGDGFDSKGSIGVVMLDPAQFNIDLPGLVKDSEAMSKAKLPFVIFLPGKGVKEVLGKWEMETAGKLQKVKLPPGEMMAAKFGDHVIVSPNAKALEAIMEKGKTMSQVLTKEQLAEQQDSDLVLYLNMKVAGPILGEFTKMAEQMSRDPGVAMVMPTYRKMIEQMDALSFTGKFVKEGVVVKEHLAFVKDSEIGKLYAAMGKQVTDRTLVEKLPAMNYIMAAGGLGNVQKMQIEQIQQMLDQVFAMPEAQKISQQTRAKAKTTLTDIAKQVKEGQFVFSMTPAGRGTFAVGLVLTVEDSAKFRDLLADAGKTFAQGLIEVVGEEAKGFSVDYKKQSETVNDAKVDVMEVVFPPSAHVSEQNWAEYQKVFGERRGRALVAAPDKTTIVLTFGGRTEFMGEVLKTYKGTGAVVDKDAQVALKYMPAKRVALALFNAANLSTAISRLMDEFGGQKEAHPQFTSKIPLAIGATVEGNSASVNIFIPTGMVADTVKFIQELEKRMRERMEEYRREMNNPPGSF